MTTTALDPADLLPARYQRQVERIRAAGWTVEATITPLHGGNLVHVVAKGRAWFDPMMTFGVRVPDKGRSRFIRGSVHWVSKRPTRITGPTALARWIGVVTP